MADTRKLYAIAAKMGLVRHNDPDDAFHQLVYAMTGKEHVSELTEEESEIVKKELIRLSREEVPNMITLRQQKYAWRLVYRLKKLDGKNAPVNRRMAGAIRKALGITASPDEPFRWVNKENGSKLIEALKRYVKSAERKARDG